MTILRGTSRYIFCLSVLIFILQVAVANRPKQRERCNSFARESWQLPNRSLYKLKFVPSPSGILVSSHKVHGSPEASDQDAVFIASNFFTIYGISITSVRITGVMRSD